MRTAVALATALSGSIIGIIGAAAPAHAETCEPPPPIDDVFNIYTLTAHQITCHDARNLAVHTLRHGGAPGFDCIDERHGRRVSWSCRGTHDPSHSYHFSYHEDPL